MARTNTCVTRDQLSELVLNLIDGGATPRARPIVGIVRAVLSSVSTDGQRWLDNAATSLMRIVSQPRVHRHVSLREAE